MTRLHQRIENFKKAYILYDEIVNLYLQDKNANVNKLALIQSFEVVLELAWKVLKDELDLKGIKVFTPKDTIKEAFSAEIIKNAQTWIDMIDDRNTSSHEYNEEKLNLVFEKIASKYYSELKNFSKQSEEF